MDGWVVIGIVLAAWIAGAIVFVHRASAVFSRRSDVRNA